MKGVWGDRGLCYLIENGRGDPISGLYFGEDIVVVGTFLGRVIGFNFSHTANSSVPQSDVECRQQQLRAAAPSSSSGTPSHQMMITAEEAAGGWIDSDGGAAYLPPTTNVVHNSDSHQTGVANKNTASAAANKNNDGMTATAPPSTKTNHANKEGGRVNRKEEGGGKPISIRHGGCVARFLKPRGTYYPSLSHAPLGTFQLYAAFSDSAVKALYATNSTIYCIVGTAQCRTWDRRRPRRQGGFRLDSRIVSSHLFTLSSHNSPHVLIVNAGNTLLINQVKETQLLCPLKVSDRDLIPIDFDAVKLRLMILKHKSRGETELLAFELPDEDSQWAKKLLPCKKTVPAGRVIFARFWALDRIVVVVDKIKILVYDCGPASDDASQMTLRGHTDSIVAIEGSREEELVSLGRDCQLIIWGRDGTKLSSFNVAPAEFWLGFPYYICRDKDSGVLAFSSDGGLYLFDPSRGALRDKLASKADLRIHDNDDE